MRLEPVIDKSGIRLTARGDDKIVGGHHSVLHCYTNRPAVRTHSIDNNVTTLADLVVGEVGCAPFIFHQLTTKHDSISLRDGQQRKLTPLPAPNVANVV